MCPRNEREHTYIHICILCVVLLMLTRTILVKRRKKLKHTYAYNKLTLYYGSRFTVCVHTFRSVFAYKKCISFSFKPPLLCTMQPIHLSALMQRECLRLFFSFVQYRFYVFSRCDVFHEVIQAATISIIDSFVWFLCKRQALF